MNWSLFLTHFKNAAWQIKFRIAAIFLITLLIAIAYLRLETTTFKTSWVMLLPGTERSSSLSLDNIGEARSSGNNAYARVSISPKNTYKEIALSDAVISKAARKYGVDINDFAKPKIKLIDQTPAMEFTLKGSSVEELANIAKLYNETFHDVLDQLRKNEIERYYRGVEGSLSEAKARLSRAREEIIEYQSNSNIIADSQFQAWLSEAHEIRRKQGQASIKDSILEASIASELTQLGITKEQALAFHLIQANPTTQSALQLLSTKLTKQSSVEKVYGIENPIRKMLNKEIKGIKATLKSNLASVPNFDDIAEPKLYGLLAPSMNEVFASLNTKIASLAGSKAEIKALETLKVETLARIKSHTQQAATLSDLKRDHQIAEAIFSSALAKLDTSRLDIYATYPLTQLLTQPASTIKPDRLQEKVMVIALFLVFLLLVVGQILIQLRINIINDKGHGSLMAKAPITHSVDE